MLRRTSSDTSGVYVYDGRGSVVETVVGGKISSVLHYDPFGNITKGAPEQEQIFGYNGEQYTPQSGFIYFMYNHHTNRIVLVVRI